MQKLPIHQDSLLVKHLNIFNEAKRAGANTNLFSTWKAPAVKENIFRTALFSYILETRKGAGLKWGQ